MGIHRAAESNVLEVKMATSLGKSQCPDQTRGDVAQMSASMRLALTTSSWIPAKLSFGINTYCEMNSAGGVYVREIRAYMGAQSMAVIFGTLYRVACRELAQGC